MANRTFKDIDLSFEPHPTTGDLRARIDDSAVKNAIKNLVITKHYERAFHSEIGSSVMGLLFNPADLGLIALLRREITQVIANFEPRAEVLKVDVGFSPDNNAVGVTIIFRIINTTTPLSVSFTLDRTR